MTELLLGISLGWAAGISPGPLLALVVTSALQRGTAAGIRVALAPLITDAPVVVAAIVVLSSVPDRVVRWLGVMGGIYLIWLGVSEIRVARTGQGSTEPPGGVTDLRRGALTNILNPQMWTFWIAVGGPIVASADSAAAAGLFLLGFYVLLLGSKVVVAAVVGSSRRRLLDSRWMQKLGVAGGLGMIAIGLVLAFRS